MKAGMGGDKITSDAHVGKRRRRRALACLDLPIISTCQFRRAAGRAGLKGEGRAEGGRKERWLGTSLGPLPPAHHLACLPRRLPSLLDTTHLNGCLRHAHPSHSHSSAALLCVLAPDCQHFIHSCQAT